MAASDRAPFPTPVLPGSGSMGWLAPLSPCRDTPTDLIEKVAARKRDFNLCVSGRDHEFGWACWGGLARAMGDR